MSGRRLRDTVSGVLTKALNMNVTVVVAGLSNAYSHYVTTYQEFLVQRYEGASTLYGPHTLEAYQQEYAGLALALATGAPVPPGPSPPDLSDYTLPNFLPPVIEDRPPLFGYFGQILQDANPSYNRGDTVTVSFWGANLRNNYMIESTFLTVEKQNASNSWNVVLNDGAWETKLYWESVWILESNVTITWDIMDYTEIGTYRIRTFGYSKDIFGYYTPYTGSSSQFQVN